MGLYDIHIHILPGVDDGAADKAAFQRMLDKCVQQGVSGIIATPHYYSEENIPEFLKRRDRAFESVKDIVSDTENALKICLGAEVAYRAGISSDKNLKSLCLGGSDYILVEMPFRKWEEGEVCEIELMASYGFKPVIAHIERYMDFQDKKTLKRLFSMPVLIQSNAGFFLNKKTSRKAFKMAVKGQIQIVSSDAHNTSSRPPNLKVLSEAPHAEKLQEVFTETESVFLKAYESAPPHLKA